MGWNFDKYNAENPMESRDFLKRVVFEFNRNFIRRELILETVSREVKNKHKISENNKENLEKRILDYFIITVPELDYRVEIFSVEQSLFSEYPITVFDFINDNETKCNNFEELKKGINNIKFIVMGDGPLKQEFEEYAKERNINCEFTGKLKYENMIGLLCSCDIAVNPIKAKSAGSIINKVGDYAAAGLPVINSQESKEYRYLIDENQIGINVENDDSNSMSSAIELMCSDYKKRKEYGNNNRKLAEKKFDRQNTYSKIINVICK